MTLRARTIPSEVSLETILLNAILAAPSRLSLYGAAWTAVDAYCVEYRKHATEDGIKEAALRGVREILEQDAN